uniref:Endonuclease/exonuclease/phosphatase domain-containing protein n=1 Tax=Panagrolaimus davidi TaxID=227884 RepID=A0A914Q546_9BILA
MLKPHCNHDPKYMEKRTRKRRHVSGGVKSPSVPPKIPSLENGNNYSLSRDTLENNYQKEAGFNLNISAGGGNVGSLKNVNILAIAAGLAEHDKSSSFVCTSEAVQESSTSINCSVMSAAEIWVPKNNSLPEISTPKKDKRILVDDDEDVICLTETSKSNEKLNADVAESTSIANENPVPDEITFNADEHRNAAVTEHSPNADEKLIASETETPSKDDEKPTLATNTVTIPESIEVITLDSDTEDESNDDKAVEEIQAKAVNESSSSSSSSSDTTSSDDTEIQIAAASSNVTVTTKTFFTEDTYVANLNDASLASTSCVQEITVISSSKTIVNDRESLSNDVEKSVEAIHDATPDVNNDVNLKNVRISSNTTPTVSRTVNTPAFDLLTSLISNIATASVESILNPQSEHLHETAIISSDSALSNNQIPAACYIPVNAARYSSPNVTPQLNLTTLSTDTFAGSPNVSPKFTSQLNLNTSSTSATSINQNSPPNVASSICSNDVPSTSAVKSTPDFIQSRNIERTITHFQKSQKDLSEMELDEHKDSSSYFVAKETDDEILRGPEILDNLANIDASKSFAVLSYNVLSQTKIEKNRNLYPKINKMPQIFQWNYRWKLLSIELDRFHADICCLQEVEKDRVEKYYHPKMVGIKNYKSFYAWNIEGEISDGCAIYWNSEKFDKIEEHVIPLNYGVPNLNKSNVAQILYLKHKRTGKELLVANTQLISDPKSGLQKLYQISVFFAHLHKIRTNNQSIIFCGDFGFLPYSHLYNFITDGELDCAKDKITSLDGKRSVCKTIESFSIPAQTRISNNCTFIDEVREKSNTSTVMRHSLNLESVYGKLTFDGNNLLSTYHHKSKNSDFENQIFNFGKSDYIFYSIKEKNNVRLSRHDVTERNLFLHQRLSLPDKESLEDLVEHTPHRITGSDHLPLYAEFFLA